MSPPKTATCTTRACGRTGFCAASRSERRYSTSKRGGSPIPFVCIPKKPVIIRGGTIARERFVATWDCASITYGPQRRWPSAAGPPGSTKNRARGSGHPTTRRLLRSLTDTGKLRLKPSRSHIANREVETTVHDVKNDADDKKQRPNQHDVPEVELAGVHPAPDEGPKAAGDDADNAVHHAAILELLNQDNDQTNQIAERRDQRQNS